MSDKRVQIIVAGFLLAAALGLAAYAGAAWPARANPAGGAPVPTRVFAFDDDAIPGLDTAAGKNAVLEGGGAVKENGVRGSYLELKDGAFLSFPDPLFTADGATLAMYVNPSSRANYQKLFTIGVDTTVFLQIYLMAGSEPDGMDFELTLTDVGPNRWENQVGGGAAKNSVKNGVWNHVAVTIDGDYVTLYVDGSPVAEKKVAFSLAELRDAGPHFWLGKSEWADPFLEGGIDELQVFDRALSEAETAALSGVTPPKPDVESGLTQYYSFDNAENLGVDNSGNGRHAAADVEPTAGKKGFGTAAGFTEGFLQLPDNAVGKEADAFTLSVWINPTSAGDFQKIASLGSGQDVFLQIALRTGEEGRLHIQTGLTVNGDMGDTAVHLWGGTCLNAVRLNEWQHVAVTVSGRSARLYVDGRVLVYGEFAKSVSEFAAYPQTLNLIGKSYFADPNFLGCMDELALYARALTGAEVRALAGGALPEKKVTDTVPEEYDVLTGLDYYYSFAGGAPGVDYSGNCRNAKTMRGMRTETRDPAGEALGAYAVFDGETDLMIAPQNAIDKTANAFTFAAWVRFDATDEYTRIFDFGETSVYLDLRLRREGVLESSITANYTQGETKIATGSGCVQAGKWTHVALTISGREAAIYVNGAKSAAGAFGREVSSLYGKKTGVLTQCFVGYSRYGQDPRFTGGMDEIRIYSRALAQADVRYLAMGFAAAPENAETDGTARYIGEAPREEYLSSASEDILVEEGALRLKRAFTAGELLAALAVADGAVAQAVDLYDAPLPENAAVDDTCSVRVIAAGIVAQRARLYTAHRVAFDAAGGMAVAEAYVHCRLETVPDAYRYGYDFKGWRYASGEAFDPDRAVTENLTLTAAWEKAEFTVWFDTRGYAEIAPIRAGYGDTVLLPLPEDGSISGWRYRGEIVADNRLVMPGNAAVLEPVWNMEYAYTAYNGEWSQGPETGARSERGYSLALYDGVALADGVIEAEVTPGSPNDSGLVFRCDTGGAERFWETYPVSYYCALINCEGYVILGRVDTHADPLWTCPADSRKYVSGFDPTKTYAMRVELSGANIKVYVDGELLIDYTDPVPLTGTRAGFRATKSGAVIRTGLVRPAAARGRENA